MGTLSEQSEEKHEESQETVRDAAIVVTMHTFGRLEVRDEFIAIGVRMNMCRELVDKIELVIINKNEKKTDSRDEFSNCYFP